MRVNFRGSDSKKYLGLMFLSLFPLSSLADFSASQLPPGCLEVKGTIGGCNGKTQIQDAKVSPACLEVSVNNCKGGLLELKNSCKAGVSLGDLTLPVAGKEHVPVWFELYRTPKGAVKARLANPNGETYVPAKTEELKLRGKVGGQPVLLSYTKSHKLCP